jgi:tight adherence protein C
MDLIIVCIEAGLGLDAAIARTGQEMRLRSPALAGELHLVTLELRVGVSREQALQNLALRTGLDEVASLVTMLRQADRFGTSIAESLRVHADSLRTRRRQRAEEAAAKIPLKLLFPLIFCIFPSLMLVLLGPAVISIYRIFLKNLGS